MIPANYTRDSFSDYLQFEVLMEAAPELGWTDIIAPFDATTLLDDGKIIGNGKIYLKQAGSLTNSAVILPSEYVIPIGTKINIQYVTKNTSAVAQGATSIAVLALPTAIPSGTTLIFSNAGVIVATVKTSANAAIGATSITIPALKQGGIATDSVALFTSGVLTTAARVEVDDVLIKFTSAFTASTGGVIGTFYNSPFAAGDQVRHTRYGAIIDEVMVKLGITDISSLSSISQLRKLRLFGRRECWSFAMQSLASSYNYSNESGSANRQEIYDSARSNFELEDGRIDATYSQQDEVAPQMKSLFNISSPSKIKVRW